MNSWLRVAAVIAVGAVCLAMRHNLNTRRLAGEQWPAAAELDSLRRFLQPVAAERAQIASFGYEDLSAHDPFESRGPLPEAVAVEAPTERAETREVQPRSALTVSAILITGDQKVAVVNNALVRVGSTLPDGGRVVVIERDHVVVVSPQGARVVLRLNQGG